MATRDCLGTHADSKPLLSVVVNEMPFGMLVRLAGDAVLEEIDELEFHLMFVIARRPTLVILDLAELRSVGLRGIGALVEFRRGIVRLGSKVRLTSLQPQVEDQFRRLRLHELFSIYASPEKAVAS